jgi:hypothetical protein
MAKNTAAEDTPSDMTGKMPSVFYSPRRSGTLQLLFTWRLPNR